MCTHKTLELKKLCYESAEKVLILELRKVKKVSVLGEKNFLIKTTCNLRIMQGSSFMKTHSCQVSESRMLENKECCAALLRNCEGAYCAGHVQQEEFIHKVLIRISSAGDLKPSMYSSLFSSTHSKLLEKFPDLLERCRQA